MTVTKEVFDPKTDKWIDPSKVRCPLCKSEMWKSGTSTIDVKGTKRPSWKCKRCLHRTTNPIILERKQEQQEMEVINAGRNAASTRMVRPVDSNSS